MSDDNIQDPSKQRIEELENALRSCLVKCMQCGGFATWDCSGSNYGYRPSFCDSCKLGAENKRFTSGRLVGELQLKDWVRLDRNIELTAIYIKRGAATSNLLEAQKKRLEELVGDLDSDEEDNTPALSTTKLSQETVDAFFEEHRKMPQTSEATREPCPACGWPEDEATAWAKLQGEQIAHLCDEARKEARAEAIEECAKVVEALVPGTGPITGRYDGYRFTLEHAVIAIRALPRPTSPIPEGPCGMPVSPLHAPDHCRACAATTRSLTSNEG